MAGKKKNNAAKEKKKQQTKLKANFSKISKHIPPSLTSNFPRCSSRARVSISNISKLAIYESVVKKPLGSALNVQDLDKLQLDLETALVTVTQRSRTLVAELSNLSATDEPADEVPNTSHGLSSTEKQVKYEPNFLLSKSDSKQSLRLKSKREKPLQKLDAVPPAAKERKKKGRGLPVQRKHNQRSKPVRKYSAFDMSSKYWLSLKHILRDLEGTDLDTLRRAINIRKEETINQPIADGKPYVHLWAETELIEEKMRGSTTIGRKKRAKLEPVTINILKNIKRGEHLSSDATMASTEQSSLEQQLLVSLKSKYILQDNLEANLQDNSADLETCIRRDLEYHGILSPMPLNMDNFISHEIMHLESELKVVESCNLEALMMLLKISEDEKGHQDNLKKLFLLNENILKTYHGIRLSKSGDTPINRRKKQEALKLLQARDLLVAEMNMLY